MRQKLVAFVVLNFMAVSFCFSQEADSSYQDSAVANYDFLILGVEYQRAITFLGRDFGNKIPVLSFDMMYYFQSGIYLTATSLKFFEEDLTWQHGLSLGYFGDLSPKTDLNVSYSQFFGGSNVNVAGVDKVGFLQGTFGWDWGGMYSTTQLQVVVNQPSDFYIASNHSRYFEVDRAVFGSGLLSFQPGFSFTLGTSRFYQIGGYDLNEEEMATTNKFQFQVWELYLPVNLNFGYFDIEFQPKLVNPVNVPEYDSSKGRFVGSLQLSYTLPIKNNR